MVFTTSKRHFVAGRTCKRSSREAEAVGAAEAEA
jgi:hypothetical protein